MIFCWEVGRNEIDICVIVNDCEKLIVFKKKIRFFFVFWNEIVVCNGIFLDGYLYVWIEVFLDLVKIFKKYLYECVVIREERKKGVYKEF